MKSWKKEFLKEWWNKHLDYLPLGAKYRGKWQKRVTKGIIKELDERQLDIQIAQQVFGYMVNVKEETEYLDYGRQVDYPELKYLAEVYIDGSGERWELLPYYSTDIKDAFLIVDKFKTIPIPKDWEDCFQNDFPIIIEKDYYSDEWRCSWKGSYYAIEFEGRARTPELAICKAVLSLRNKDS